jgi:hypothetical protein
MAVAVRSCWRCVRANPRYRLRRRSKRRPPCERLLSTPARRVYCALNSGVFWRWRAAWSASWYACSRTVSCRGASFAVGPERRTDHIDLVLALGGDQEVRIDIAAVEQVDAWEDIPIG